MVAAGCNVVKPRWIVAILDSRLYTVFMTASNTKEVTMDTTTHPFACMMAEDFSALCPECHAAMEAFFAAQAAKHSLPN